LGNGWYDVTPLNREALTKAFDHLDIFNPGTSNKSDLASRIFKDPFGSAVSGVTKFTSLVQDLINPVENVRPINERANLMIDENDRFQFSPSDVNINGFEIITCVSKFDINGWWFHTTPSSQSINYFQTNSILRKCSLASSCQLFKEILISKPTFSLLASNLFQ